MPRRLVAGHEQEGELGAHLEIGEALAVDFGVDEPRDEVVGWIGRGLAFGDHRVEVGGEVGRDAGEALAVDSVLSAVLRRVGGLHDEVGPLGEAGVIGGIDAEEMRDHGGRDRVSRSRPPDRRHPARRSGRAVRGTTLGRTARPG